jgi:hypothetical protein
LANLVVFVVRDADSNSLLAGLETPGKSASGVSAFGGFSQAFICDCRLGPANPCKITRASSSGCFSAEEDVLGVEELLPEFTHRAQLGK